MLPKTRPTNDLTNPVGTFLSMRKEMTARTKETIAQNPAKRTIIKLVNGNFTSARECGLTPLSTGVRPHSRALVKLPLTNLMMVLFAGFCAIVSFVRAVISFRIDKNVPTGLVRSFVGLVFGSMAIYLVAQPQ